MARQKSKDIQQKLAAALMRLDFAPYTRSSEFKHLLVEHGLQYQWLYLKDGTALDALLFGGDFTQEELAVGKLVAVANGDTEGYDLAKIANEDRKWRGFFFAVLCSFAKSHPRSTIDTVVEHMRSLGWSAALLTKLSDCAPKPRSNASHEPIHNTTAQPGGSSRRRPGKDEKNMSKKGKGLVAPRLTPRTSANAEKLPSQADIAFVTILPEEYEAVKRRLKNVRRDPGSKSQPNQYAWIMGEIDAAQGGTYKVVVAMTIHPGNTSGSLAIAKTIARWRPRYVLLVGIAGGLPRDRLQLGDVVVSKQIIGYEYGKVERKAFNPRPDFVHQVDGPLLRSALSLDGSNWQSDLGRRPSSDRGKSKVLVGMLGSGEKVIDDRSAGFFAAVEKLAPKLLAVEMEGAGAAAAIQEARDEGHTVGFLMIRGISDMPPGKRTGSQRPDPTAMSDAPVASDRDHWKAYAANAAASFAACFVAQAWPLPPMSEESEHGMPVSNLVAADSTARRHLVAEQLRLLIKNGEETFSTANQANFSDTGAESLKHWKVRAMKFVDSNVSNEEAREFAKIRTSIHSGTTPQHFESSFVNHVNFLKALLEQVVEDKDVPISLEPKPSGKRLPVVLGFAFKAPR